MKRVLLPILFIVLCALGLTNEANAQPAVSGGVADQNGHAIAGARVTLKSTSATVALAAVTGSDGSFSFKTAPQGRYKLLVSASGFETAEQDIEVTAGGVRDLNITLAIGRSHITVTAEVGQTEDRRDVPQPVSVIGAETIQQRATAVLAQAAQEEAGLNVQRTSPTIGAIVVRGLTGKNVVNYVDGVRYTNGAQRGGINTFFNLNDASSLDAIDVLRGPNGAQYGSDSLAGAVNLVSKTPLIGVAVPEFHGEVAPSFTTADHSFGSSAQLSYGSRRFGGYISSFGRRIGDLRTAGGIDSHSAITRFLGLPSTALYKRSPETGFKQYGISTRMAYAPRDDQQLTFFYQRSQQDDGKRFDQLIGGDGNLIADLRNLMLDFGYFRYVKQGLGFFDSGSFTMSYNTQREERVNQGGQGNPFGDITHQYERTSTLGWSFFLDKRVGDRNTFLIGGDHYREGIDSPAFIVNPITNTSTLSRPRVPDNARFNSGGVFIQDQWNAVPDRLRVTGALRYGGARYRARGSDAPIIVGRPLWVDDSLSVSALSGRVGAVIRLSNEWRLALNHGRGFRYPNMTDLGTLGLTGDGYEVDHITSAAMGGLIGTTAGTDAVSTGIPVSKQRSEISNNFDGGVRYNSKRVDVNFTAFRLDINDAIVKQTLILPQGAVGRFLGSEQIISQLPSGAVFVAASANPVLVRANYSDAKIWGMEYEMEARLTRNLLFSGNFTYSRAEDKANRNPPNIEGGTPPPTGFLSLRRNWERFWIEGYTTLAARQDRLSSGDLNDRRTGAVRTRTQIENFFRRGACVSGLTSNATGTCNGAVAGYTLKATGENITQVLNRVLGPGFPNRPLFSGLPGYGLVNLRGGITINDRAKFFWAFENIFDHFYRNPSWGIDGTGRSFTGQLRLRF